MMLAFGRGYGSCWMRITHEHSRMNPTHIHIEHRDAPPIGEGENRSGRVLAHPRKCAQFFQRLRYLPVVSFHHLTCRGMHPQCSAGIPETIPLPDDIRRRTRG